MEKINFASKSFIGKRSNNQDNCLAKKIKENVYFLAVADGMGGTSGGQIASKLVIDNAIKILEDEFNSEPSPKEMKDILTRIFNTSQKVLSDKIKQDMGLTGMGTTLTCILINDDKYVWGNLGDSRIYLLRNNLLNQITEDHTYIQDFINKSNGESVPSEVLNKYGNYLLKALDGGSDQPEIFPKGKDFEMLLENDIFLLCSDGLITDKVQKDNSLFKDYILSSKDLTEAAEQLISHAYYNGSTDNISVVIFSAGDYKKLNVKIQKYPYPPFEKVEIKTVKKKLKINPQAILASLIVIVAVILFYLIIPNHSEKNKDELNSSNNIIIDKNNEKDITLDNDENINTHAEPIANSEKRIKDVDKKLDDNFDIHAENKNLENVEQNHEDNTKLDETEVPNKNETDTISVYKNEIIEENKKNTESNPKTEEEKKDNSVVQKDSEESQITDEYFLRKEIEIRNLIKEGKKSKAEDELGKLSKLYNNEEKYNKADQNKKIELKKINKIIQTDLSPKILKLK